MTLQILIIVLSLVAITLLIIVLRKIPDEQDDIDIAALLAKEFRSNRTEAAEDIRRLREELSHTYSNNAKQLREEFANTHIESNKLMRETLSQFNQTQNKALNKNETAIKELIYSNEIKLDKLRETLEVKLKDLQDNNEKKLDQMRETVDEKLQTTLEKRLGESFRLVSERLEAVQRGLGDMQNLATGVGDLKRVLSNVKTRGTLGEYQLESILSQVLTPDQYEKNVQPNPSSRAVVEFAVKLPGQDDTPLWLPIDSKFPMEDYQRLLEAAELGDKDAVDSSTKELVKAIRIAAKAISSKYIEPPHTTDFAILFLPTEGLYSEVLRQPDLVNELQRSYRVVITGPTTLSATLSSLRMGFKTLAIEKRSSEVWKVLSAVKSEFSRFGDVLAKVKKQLDTASSTLEKTDVRSRAMERKLKDVETLPNAAAEELLGIPSSTDTTRHDE